jgi:hypothetical protein
MHHGASLTVGATLLPMSVQLNAKHGEFSRGVLAAIADLVTLIGQSPEGRQAILDLGFQPILEHVEGD